MRTSNSKYKLAQLNHRQKEGNREQLISKPKLKLKMRCGTFLEYLCVTASNPKCSSKYFDIRK